MFATTVNTNEGIRINDAQEKIATNTTAVVQPSTLGLEVVSAAAVGGKAGGPPLNTTTTTNLSF